jgi:CxxC-x17-CxxC domain-containing protein
MSAAPRYPITCRKCGVNDTVPFQPSSGRAIFCRVCHNCRRDHAKAESSKRILEATGTSDQPFRTVLYDAT